MNWALDPRPQKRSIAATPVPAAPSRKSRTSKQKEEE